MTISDPAQLVGSLGCDGVMNVTTGNTDFLCPGDVKYMEVEVEKGLARYKYEAPSEAKVAGLGFFLVFQFTLEWMLPSFLNPQRKSSLERMKKISVCISLSTLRNVLMTLCS